MIPGRDHLDAGDAALYALGALDDPRRRTLDRHLRGCTPCLQLVGQAEDDVARLAGSEPERHWAGGRAARLARPGRAAAGIPAWAALAAVLVAAVLPAAYFGRQVETMRHTLQLQAEAVDRLAAAPFRTAAFRGMENGAGARVMYAPDGSWYLVIVRGASRPMGVAWMHGSERTMLGSAEPHGGVATLYLPRSHRMDRLALMDGAQVVAEATLAY